MPTEKTPAQLLQEELEALRLSDQQRAERVRRIETMQLPFIDEALSILLTLPDAVNALNAVAANTTDQRQNAIHNITSHVDYAVQYLSQEKDRISGQAAETNGQT